MKLQNLFENQEVLDNQYAEWYDYVYHDALLSDAAGFNKHLGPKVEELKKAGSKFPHFEAMKSLPEQIRKMLDDNSSIESFRFSPQGISSDASIMIENYDVLGPPPFKILSAKWFTVGQGFGVSAPGSAKTLKEIPDWFPSEIYASCAIKGTSLKTLSKIDSVIKSCKNLKIDNMVIPKGGLLGLLRINNLSRLSITLDTGSADGWLNIDATELRNFQNAMDIVERHLHGDKDVFECQEELINAGLDEYAQI